MPLKYEKFKPLDLRTHPTINEKWVQDRIAEDPSLLGLGEVTLHSRERVQPRGGRLDILLEDADEHTRYEVEIQLGKTDESHIIRTLEYWDLERKRYPNYDHVAVIVAEEITGRFLNVISLFNGHIPLVAVQMRAVQLGDAVSLIFTTVLDQVSLGREDEDDKSEATDRAYWETRATKATVAMADECLPMLKQLDPAIELKYNKFYIGLARDGIADNFVTFRPKKNHMRVEPRLKKDDGIEGRIEEAGLTVLDYDSRWGRYRIRIDKGEIEKHAGLLADLFKSAYAENSGEPA